MQTRRSWLALFAAAAGSAVAAPLSESLRKRIAAFLETHRRPEGGYGWASDVIAHTTPTFGVVGSYRLLGLPVPEAAAVARFVRENYPVPEIRRKDRPLWRLDFEQLQTLSWLGESIDSFRPLASTWKQPAEFTRQYELGGNPVFQHQAMAVRVRHLLGLSPSTEDAAWRAYFQARRRNNGTFNTTPAEDGSPGHVMNTLWGLLACECLGVELPPAPGLAEWVRGCQLPSGGFTYAPDAKLGAVDDIAYTWCALQILDKLGAQPTRPEECGRWIDSLLTAEGGFQDRPGGEPNPLATFYALDSLRLLKREPRMPARPAARAPRSAIPKGADVFSIQVEAPGVGSPREAVLLVKTLNIHIWTAKNSPPGWIEEARRVAAAERVPVQFHIGDEEYGTYAAVEGHGCYSHLVDLVAPFENGAGKRMEKMKHPYPWSELRDTRIADLRKRGGRMIWQFLENEELTRILLDEAVEKGTYAAVSTFHFGNENFLHSQPFLHRWYRRLPFVGLQDAHGSESWWWGDQLAGFTTLFVAREPTWEGWLEALDRNLVMSVRHDAITGWKTHFAGGTPELHRFLEQRSAWRRLWDGAGRGSRRPAASLVLLRPGMKFEVAAPETGLALRLRLWQDNTGAGIPRQPRTELVELTLDGKRVEPDLKESKADRYYLYTFPAEPGRHTAEARVRILESGNVVTISTTWKEEQSV
ncbi:MAG: prenyltransferase/squalene oxidase repeat-containing protein [Rhodospirillales bacterium]